MTKQMEHYEQYRARIVAFLGGRCVQCGSCEALEIDHVDPAQKAFSIGIHWSRAWDKIEPEVRKCQLLCTVCHAKKHAAQHGSIAMYRHHRCRCDACRSVWNAAVRKWKAR